MMKQHTRIIALVLCIGVLLSLLGCAKEPAAANSGISSGYAGTVEGIAFTLADVGGNVNLKTEVQNQFLADLAENGEYDKVFEYAVGQSELSKPAPVSLSWEAKTEEEILRYTVQLSLTEDMSQVVYSVTTATASAEVYNLELGRTYYWTVTAELAGRQITSGIASFTTDSRGPRNLDIDGVTNVRDIGGWETADGTRVKQGLIYRSGRFNTSDVPELNVEITSEGTYVFKRILGVRTELDLREDAEAANITESPMGSDVNYYRIPMTWDGDIIADNLEPIKQIFAVLAEEENYPMVIHCNIGTDRTGAICFLLNALLGVSEGDLSMDYAFSNFGAIGSSRSVIKITDSYLPLIQQSQGENLQEKTYHYLLAGGVPAEHLDAVIRIMKEEK